MKKNSYLLILALSLCSCEKFKDFFPPATVDCQGKALQFDGVDDYVNVGEKPNLIMSSVFTLEAWIYPTGIGSSETEGGIIMNREGEYEIARFSDGTIQFGIPTPSLNWDWVNTGYVAPLNEWTHIALTFSEPDSMIIVYANGSVVSTTTVIGDLVDIFEEHNEFWIGARMIDFGEYHKRQHFDGAIDEVRVWNTVLSIVAIQQWMNKPITSSHPNYSNLQGYWKLDEGSDTITKDASPNGYGGVLQNGPSWIKETRNCTD